METNSPRTSKLRPQRPDQPWALPKAEAPREEEEEARMMRMNEGEIMQWNLLGEEGRLAEEDFEQVGSV